MTRRVSRMLAALTVALAGFLWPQVGQAHSEDPNDGHNITDTAVKAELFDEATALKYSQAALGRVVGEHVFRDTGSRKVRFSEFRGRPLVVSFIYTSCAHSCGVLTNRLADALEVAKDALGADSFATVTIGFDTPNDTTSRMRAYARQRGVEGTPGWHFLSGDADTVKSLAETLGFISFASPKGFDHLAQTTVIDKDGKVFRQIYGENFDTPLLVEPLRALVFGTDTPFSSLENLIKKVRLFCTIYDPTADRYRFDYGLFVQIAAGAMVIGGTIFLLVREILGSRRRRRPPKDSMKI